MASTPRPAGGDVDIGYKLEIAATVTFIAAFIVVGLRFMARMFYARLGWDDYLMVFATAQAFVATVLDFVAVHWGLGRHIYFLNPQQQVKQQFYSQLAQIFCIHALTFAKISICLQYVRVIRSSQKKTWLRWTCYTIAILVFFVNGMVSIVTYAHCLPAEKTWNSSIQGTCWTFHTFGAFLILQGSFSAATDYILCILPIFLFKDLQVGKKSKIILCTLMGLGLITGIFATIRTAKTVSSLKTPTKDTPYTSIISLTWASLERNIAIMIGSIPCLRPLTAPFVTLVSKTFSKLNSSIKKSRTESLELGSKGSGTNEHNHYDLVREDGGVRKGKRAFSKKHDAVAEEVSQSSVTRWNISQERILP